MRVQTGYAESTVQLSPEKCLPFWMNDLPSNTQPGYSTKSSKCGCHMSNRVTSMVLDQLLPLTSKPGCSLYPDRFNDSVNKKILSSAGNTSRFLLDDLVDLHPICLFGYLPVVFQNRLETTKQPLTFVETKSALSAFAKNYLDAGGPPPWIRTF